MKRNRLTYILISGLIALGVFFVVGPTLASALESSQNTNLSYETEIRVDVNNFSQIIVRDSNGKVTFITDEPLTHSNPSISGTNLVWMAQIDSKWQIFFHQIRTGKTIQLTKKGNNVNPKISGNKIVWEGFYQDTWQIYMFDGLKITQITSGKEPKQDVNISGNSITYAQKDAAGWKIYLYDATNNNQEILSEQTSGRSPSISNNIISWNSYDDLGQVTYEFDKNTKKVKKITREPKEVSTENNLPEISETPETPEIIDQDEPEIEAEIEPVTKKEIIEEITQNEVPESTPSFEENSFDTQNIEDIEESTSSAQ
jgi:beta propeller repeat protein